MTYYELRNHGGATRKDTEEQVQDLMSSCLRRNYRRESLKIVKIVETEIKYKEKKPAEDKKEK